MKLLLQALTKFAAGLLLVGALLFLPAGGFDYGNGWLFIGLLFLPMLALGAVLVVRIMEEEAVLTAGLPGYDVYKKKVKYRLIPFV